MINDLTRIRRGAVWMTSAAIVLTVMTGCTREDKWTRNRPKRVPVTGEILYKGKPLAEAVVTFTCTDAGRSASATTDANGKFNLSTFERGDGAVPGSQRVSISRFEVDFPGTKLVGMTAAEVNEAIAKMPVAAVDSLPPARARWLIPERYGSPDTSKLTVEVLESGENHFHFELQD
ncbi:hypothetical protein [Planctomicrobium sp. SH664]|uniref:hypothetical protein n=1 Tax=Planctomicrobium sp. SH664 TaxID=3448125 RepID=UPI003F5C1B3A